MKNRLIIAALLSGLAMLQFQTTATAQPMANTLAATSIGTTAATLNGSVNPNGAATTAYFRYGLTTNYGSFSASNTLTATNVALSISNLIGSLSPGTTYHCQLVASNSAGSSLGSDITFTTGPAAPTPFIYNPWVDTATNALLRGGVNPNGATTTAYFRYGLTTNYGSYSATNTLAATNVTLPFAKLIDGLSPGTTYRYQVVASNSEGIRLSSNWTFTTPSELPTVITLAATGVTITNATLNGSVNPNGAAATAYFRYGLTTNYGSFSATNTLAATNVTLSVSNLIDSLSPGTIYHYQLVASNSLGGDLTFTTGPVGPTVTTLAATGVTATNATLNGSVNPNGAATTAYFRYGVTTNYGSFSTTNTLAATNVTLSVANLVGSLSPGWTYHCQLVASNSAGSSMGSDVTFTSGPGVPTVTTHNAAGVTATNATFYGTVNPNGAVTTAYFRYGLTTNYGSYSTTNTFSAANVTVAVTKLITNLSPITTYHYQLVASNSVGSSLGSDVSFTTWSMVPTVTTLAATGVTATNATLNGLVNPNGTATTVYFRYGLTTNYGSYSATNTLAATNVTLSVASIIGSLSPGTVYHFQLVASNNVGATAGADMAFTTITAQPLTFGLNGAVKLPGGAFSFSFTNLSGLGFTVLGTTNLALPLSNWTVLGAPVETPAGRYQFTDPGATNTPTRFYRVRSP